ncbi:MAG: HIT domain-containing protein [Planctomycetota bacterium]
MRQLWAPWRMAYIQKFPVVKGCFLCAAGRKGKPGALGAFDRKHLVLARGRHAFVIFNRFPYSNGHLLIAPYAHTADFGGLPAETAAEITALAQRAVRALQAAMRPHGFNAGVNLGRIAGAGVADHLHWHIVPRWDADTNFMPVLADTRVIPQALAETYRIVAKAWK